MPRRTFRIALASLKHPASSEAGLVKMERAMKQASARNAQVICFPETYLPGLRGADVLGLPRPNRAAQEPILQILRGMARAHHIAVIAGMEWFSSKGLHNAALVISAKGQFLGYQAKNQITPHGEDLHYVADGKRRLFRVDGVTLGIVICHEGWRYPETVRWAARRGAQIVFQPQWTGSDVKPSYQHLWAGGRGKKTRAKIFGDSFYEKAMVCRAQENTLYFASVNTCLRFQNSATCLIGPDGGCEAFVPYGREAVLIRDVDLTKATRYYAKRYRPERYPKD